MRIRYSYTLLTTITILILVIGCCYYLSDDPEEYRIVVSEAGVKAHEPIKKSGQLPVKKPTLFRDITDVDPVSYLGQYYGVFSLNLSASNRISIGSVIRLQLPDEKLQLKVVDIYPDENRLIYEFQGESGANSLLVFFPQNGRAYVRLETKTMLFETDLDSNGVGYFYNLKEAAINGLASPYINDEIKLPLHLKANLR